jgi:serine/threonine-protein kinase RsbW
VVKAAKYLCDLCRDGAMTNAEPRTPRTVVPIEHALLIADAFDQAQVTELRHSVAACVRAAGLRDERLDDFVLAVNELITNAVRHGGGRGWLRLWSEAGLVRCEVSDHGPGISAQSLDNRSRPAPETAGGWGLWLARELTDAMDVETGPAGTTVRITTATTVPAQQHVGRHRSD